MRMSAARSDVELPVVLSGEQRITLRFKNKVFVGRVVRSSSGDKETTQEVQLREVRSAAGSINECDEAPPSRRDGAVACFYSD